MSLKNKNVLITGGGGGIGRAMAAQFVEEGANIAIVDVVEAKVSEVGAEIRLMGCCSVMELVYDLSNGEHVSNMSGELRKSSFETDILINNAGIFLERSILDLETEDWDHIINVNLRSIFLCTKAVLPSMIKKKGGKVVNVSSGAGLRGLPYACAYSASKAGVIAFTKSIAGEVESYNISVNALCPGPVDTSMFNLGDRSLKKRFKSSELIKPSEVAKVAVFLASDDSDGISGQVINVRKGARW